MFTAKEYKELNEIWDGTLSNGKDVCGKCGACCHNVEKTLFPGEYDYLVEATGQRNTSWKSVGCLCLSLGNTVKPVICKIFPLLITVTIDKPIGVDFEVPESTYSSNCSSLKVSDSDKEKIANYMNYLFSDIHNRMFYVLQFGIEEAIKTDKEHLKTLDKKLTNAELLARATKTVLGFSIKESDPYFVFPE